MICQQGDEVSKRPAWILSHSAWISKTCHKLNSKKIGNIMWNSTYQQNYKASQYHPPSQLCLEIEFNNFYSLSLIFPFTALLIKWYIGDTYNQAKQGNQVIKSSQRKSQHKRGFEVLHYWPIFLVVFR